MTHPAVSNLSPLTDRLVAFLKEQHRHPTPEVLIPVPESLVRVFRSFGHHLVALMLVAKSDGEVLGSEREVIFRHCAARAANVGLAMTDDEKTALHGYLDRFHPAELQLIPAMEQLAQDSKADIAGLIAAAHAMVEADGVVRLPEALYLMSLQHDLEVLV